MVKTVSVFTLIVAEGHEECRKACLVFTGSGSAGLIYTAHTQIHKYTNTKRLITFSEFCQIIKHQFVKPEFDECKNFIKEEADISLSSG